MDLKDVENFIQTTKEITIKEKEEKIEKEQQEKLRKKLEEEQKRQKEIEDIVNVTFKKVDQLLFENGNKKRINSDLLKKIKNAIKNEVNVIYLYENTNNFLTGCLIDSLKERVDTYDLGKCLKLTLEVGDHYLFRIKLELTY